MTDNDKYPPVRVHIRLYREADDVEWVTTVFEGEKDYTNLRRVLTGIGDTTRVNFVLDDGNTLYMPREIIQRCTFTVREVYNND